MSPYVLVVRHSPLLLAAGLAGSAILTTTLHRLIVTGRLRRPSQAAPAAHAKRGGLAPAMRVFAEAGSSGAWHYGLLFYFRREGDGAVWQPRSALRTWSLRSGPLQQWTLRPLSVQAPVAVRYLLIPRSWLILNGFLPPAAAVWRTREFGLRDEAVLLRAFWLESQDSP
jgi:hypothetical protein